MSGTSHPIRALTVTAARGDSDERALLRLARNARADLLAGRAGAFCARLTQHALDRALVFKVDFDRSGRIPSRSALLPQSCDQVVERERSAAGDPRVDETWPSDLRAARLEPAGVEGKSGRIEILLPGRDDPVATVQAVKTSEGWRLDDSDIVPTGH